MIQHGDEPRRPAHDERRREHRQADTAGQWRHRRVCAARRVHAARQCRDAGARVFNRGVVPAMVQRHSGCLGSGWRWSHRGSLGASFVIQAGGGAESRANFSRGSWWFLGSLMTRCSSNPQRGDHRVDVLVAPARQARAGSPRPSAASARTSRRRRSRATTPAPG